MALALRELDQFRKALLLRFQKTLSESESTLFEMWLAGEEDTRTIAERLGFTSYLPEQQYRELNQLSDRLRRKVHRFNWARAMRTLNPDLRKHF